MYPTVRPLHPPRWRRRDRGRAGRGRPEGSQRRADRLGLPHPPGRHRRLQLPTDHRLAPASLHSYGTAIDINWQTNPYGHHLITDMPIGMIEDIEAIETVGGVQVWRWGGRYRGNKDAMHFEVVASPAELVRGIRSTTTTPTPNPQARTGLIWPPKKNSVRSSAKRPSEGRTGPSSSSSRSSPTTPPPGFTRSPSGPRP
ncbi:MAG: M15 family metallopeptidase [Polaromonas sp.]|nr:M15 family metallopeptidase [Polaromonas sp.]